MPAATIPRRPIPRTKKTFPWHYWLAAAALVLALGFTGWHGYRAVRAAIFWSHHQKEPIQGWMTVRFVSHSYHVAPEILYQAIGLPPQRDRRPLRDIAKAQHRPFAVLQTSLQNAIDHAGAQGADGKP